MCSTPQKHPAAIVACSAPSGEEMGPADPGLRPSDVEVLKGRRRREMKPGIVEAMRMRRESVRIDRAFS